MKTSTIKWLKAAGIRAIKTGAQSAIATIGTTAAFNAVNWTVVSATAGLAMILSLLTSLAGLPELNKDENNSMSITEADAVNAMVTDAPTTEADNAAEIKAEREAK